MTKPIIHVMDQLPVLPQDKYIPLNVMRTIPRGMVYVPSLLGRIDHFWNRAAVGAVITVCAWHNLWVPVKVDDVYTLLVRIAQRNKRALSAEQFEDALKGLEHYLIFVRYNEKNYCIPQTHIGVDILLNGTDY